MSRHHATVGGMVISLCSAENRLHRFRAFVKQVAKRIIFRCFPVGSCVDLFDQICACEAVFQNKKLYSDKTDVIRS